MVEEIVNPQCFKNLTELNFKEEEMLSLYSANINLKDFKKFLRPCDKTKLTFLLSLTFLFSGSAYE